MKWKRGDLHTLAHDRRMNRRRDCDNARSRTRLLKNYWWKLGWAQAPAATSKTFTYSSWSYSKFSTNRSQTNHTICTLYDCPLLYLCYHSLPPFGKLSCILTLDVLEAWLSKQLKNTQAINATSQTSRKARSRTNKKAQKSRMSMDRFNWKKLGHYVWNKLEKRELVLLLVRVQEATKFEFFCNNRRTVSLQLVWFFQLSPLQELENSMIVFTFLL